MSRVGDVNKKFSPIKTMSKLLSNYVKLTKWPFSANVTHLCLHPPSTSKRSQTRARIHERARVLASSSSLSVCLSACLSVRLFVCLFVCQHSMSTFTRKVGKGERGGEGEREREGREGEGGGKNKPHSLSYIKFSIYRPQPRNIFFVFNPLLPNSPPTTNTMAF